MSESRSSAIRAVAFAGLAAGVLDITAAFVTWAPKGVSPVRILQGIASGLLGPNSFSGGAKTALLGLLLHFVIAFSAASVFYVASRKLPMLTQRPFLWGPLYGVAVYTVMYWVVMPLSRFHRGAFSLTNTVIAIVTHIVCVGLPIELVVWRYDSRR